MMHQRIIPKFAAYISGHATEADETVKMWAQMHCRIIAGRIERLATREQRVLAFKALLQPLQDMVKTEALWLREQRAKKNA